MRLTITEALSELDTIQARISKKREFIKGNVMRLEAMKDPFAKEEGGTSGKIERELQSIVDLETLHLKIRVEVQKSNHVTVINIGGRERTIAEWLTWRKELAESERGLIQTLISTLSVQRQQAITKGFTVAQVGQEPKQNDFIVNIDEAALLKRAEDIVETLGKLDGQLSLKNATTFIEV